MEPIKFSKKMYNKRNNSRDGTKLSMFEREEDKEDSVIDREIIPTQTLGNSIPYESPLRIYEQFYAAL